MTEQIILILQTDVYCIFVPVCFYILVKAWYYLTFYYNSVKRAASSVFMLR